MDFWRDHQRVRLLGKGSYGSAVLVVNKATAAHYVVKEVDLKVMDRANARIAEQEAKILLALRHPNIVACHSNWVQGGKLFIVMEYCAHGDLQGALKKQHGGAVPEERCLDWLIQMTLALKHIHDRRILHRDFKSANVFLAEGGVLKVGDFGVSTVLASTLALAKTAIGTPYYISPEICMSRPYDAKTDIWSLGCVLYEVLTLQHAFEAGSMRQLVQRIIAGRYAPVSQRYSRPLRELLCALLSVQPKQRPSAGAILRLPLLRRRIEQLLANNSGGAQQVGSTALLRRIYEAALPKIQAPPSQRLPGHGTASARNALADKALPRDERPALQQRPSRPPAAPQMPDTPSQSAPPPLLLPNLALGRQDKGAFGDGVVSPDKLLRFQEARPAHARRHSDCSLSRHLQSPLGPSALAGPSTSAQDGAVGKLLLRARAPHADVTPAAPLRHRRRSLEGAAAGFSGRDLARRRMLEAAAPVQDSAQLPGRNAPGLMRMRSLSENGGVLPAPSAEQRRVLWEDAQAGAARNRQALHAVSPSNPLAASRAVNGPVPSRRPQLPELLNDSAEEQWHVQRNGSSATAGAAKPPRSPASLAPVPFQFPLLLPGDVSEDTPQILIPAPPKEAAGRALPDQAASTRSALPQLAPLRVPRRETIDTAAFEATHAAPVQRSLSADAAGTPHTLFREALWQGVNRARRAAHAHAAAPAGGTAAVTEQQAAVSSGPHGPKVPHQALLSQMSTASSEFALDAVAESVLMEQ